MTQTHTVSIQLQAGQRTFPNCTIDVFGRGSLAVTSLSDGRTVRRYRHTDHLSACVSDEYDAPILFIDSAQQPPLAGC